MDLFEEQEIRDKMEKIKNKWPDPPEKYSDPWWRYRADQSLYIALRAKLKAKSK